MRRSRRFLLVCLVGLLAAPAFAGTAGAAKPEACDLVTTDELNAAYSATFAPAEATSPTSCYFHTTETQSISVYVNLFGSPSEKAAKVQFKVLTKPQKHPGVGTTKPKKVKGLGDDARYFPFVDAGGGSTFPASLIVRVGKDFVQVSATVTDTDLNPIEDKPAMIEVAKQAIASL